MNNYFVTQYKIYEIICGTCYKGTGPCESYNEALVAAELEKFIVDEDGENMCLSCCTEVNK